VKRLRPLIAVASGVACWTASGRPALAAGAGGIEFGDAGVAVAAVLVFLGLFLVLRRYAWGPILAQVQKREKTIADSLAAAEERQKHAQETLASVRARLDGVEEEGRQIIARIRQEGLDAKEQLLADARLEARKLSEEQRREIERAKQEAMRELYQTTADLAAEMAGSVLRRRLSEEDQRRILSGSLDDIGRQGEEGR